MRQGRGAVRGWADVRRGRVSAGTADVALADVEIKLDPALAALQLKAVSGRVAGTFSPGTLDFSTQGLEFDTADGLRWPGGNLKLTQADGVAGRPAHGELVADRLDLAVLAQIASRLPLGDALHASFLRYAPTGLVERIKAKWQGPAGAIDKYEVQARVLQLHVQAIPAAARPSGTGAAIGSPGISGAVVDVEFTESGGKAKVALQNGSIAVPGVFEDPVIPFAHLSTNLAWQLDSGKVQLQLSNLRFGNADADGDMQLKWQTSDPARSNGAGRFPGVLDLQGNLILARRTQIGRAHV